MHLPTTEAGRVLIDIHLSDCVWTLPKPRMMKGGTIPQVTTTQSPAIQP
jgi:hypothetical protein